MARETAGSTLGDLGRAESLGAGSRPRKRAPLEWLRIARAYPQLGIGMTVLAILVFCAVFAPLIAPYSPNQIDATARLEEPTRDHLFGTDTLGRDAFSRIIYGGRVSLFVALSAVAAGTAIGVLLGLISGYGFGWLDTLIMRAADGMLAFPGLILALTIAFALGASLQSIIIALIVVRIPGTARLTRGQVLALRNQDFILAANAIGVRPPRLILRHFLPNLVSIVLIEASLGAGQIVFAEASLSFLGLGVPPPTPSWGGMLRDGYVFLEVNPWLSIIPGFFIFLAVLSFNFIGDGLRDLLDPRQRHLRG